MRCVDCLPLLDEYAYGEADDRTAMLLGAHVAACEECSAALDALRAEQQLYALYERPVEVTPALWQAVRAEIARGESAAQTRPARPSPFARLRGRFASAFGPLVARPALASGLSVALVGLVSGALWLSLPARPEAPGETASAVTPVEQRTGPARPAAPPSIPEPDRGGVQVVFAGNAGRPSAVAGLPRREAQFVNAGLRAPAAVDTGGLVAAPEDLHAAEDETPLAVVPPPPAEPRDVVTAARQPDPEEKEFARHVEQAQMLLRSFKNAAPAEGAPVDLTYEKLLSQKLLDENAALRVGAEVADDKETRQVLDAIEPFLLDIKNLRERPSREEVRSIRERMKKNEIIAALQVY
jgi:hypothetical protein